MTASRDRKGVVSSLGDSDIIVSSRRNIMFRRIAPALLLTAIVLIAADQHPSNLTVNEWGTFTSIAGEDGSAMFWNSLACRADLPGFVQKFGNGGEKWNIPGNVRMETPVLYFYAAREM